MNVIEELEARFFEVGGRVPLGSGSGDGGSVGCGLRGRLRPHPGFEVAGKLDLVVVRLAAEIRMARRQQPEKRSRDYLDELATRRRGRPT